MECKFRKEGKNKKEEIWINRYIMECKLHDIYNYHMIYPELIDTLWNVN